jgi:(p)ppGpp synthase/HD superfamily hydrolase
MTPDGIDNKNLSTLSQIVESEAKYYAIKVHSETNHKYDGNPYKIHLQMVANFGYKYLHLIKGAGYQTLSDIISACWAHDVIEDCRQTYNDVAKALNKDVAEIVYALTNEKGKTRKERANEKYYEGIRSTPYAAYVKICDRLANAKYSKDSGSRMIDAYRKEYREFEKQLWSEEYKEMFLELQEILFK